MIYSNSVLPFPHTDVGYPLSDYFQRFRWKSTALFLKEKGYTLSGEKCSVDLAVPVSVPSGLVICYE